MANNILIVDDEADLREIIAEAIKGFFEDSVKIIKQSDGTKVISTLESQPIKLLIIDLRMPNKNGAEVIKEILKMESENRPEAIIAISGEISDDVGFETDLKIARLSKPIDFQKLLECIESIVPMPLEKFKIDEEMVGEFRDELTEVLKSLIDIYKAFENELENDDYINQFEKLIFGVVGTASMFNFVELQSCLTAYSKVLRISSTKNIPFVRKKALRLMDTTVEILSSLSESIDKPQLLDQLRHKMKIETISALKLAEQLPRRT